MSANSADPTVSFDWNGEQVKIIQGKPSIDGVGFGSIGELLANIYGGIEDRHAEMLEIMIQNGVKISYIREQIRYAAGEWAYFMTGGSETWKDGRAGDWLSNFEIRQCYDGLPNVSNKIIDGVWERVEELECMVWGSDEYPDFYEKHHEEITEAFKEFGSCKTPADIEAAICTVEKKMTAVFEKAMKAMAITLIQRAVDELAKSELEKGAKID